MGTEVVFGASVLTGRGSLQAGLWIKRSNCDVSIMIYYSDPSCPDLNKIAEVTDCDKTLGPQVSSL